MIASNEMVSAIDTTEVTSVQKLVCTNPNCKLFCGNDANNPVKVAEIVRTVM